MASLMLGIDFSKTDIQVSLWDEERTCADVYCFPENLGGEAVPTMVIQAEDGSLKIAKEALDYGMETQKHGVTSLYGNCSNELVNLGEQQKSVNEVFAYYLQEVLDSIRRRYGGASIAKIGVTGERLTKEKEEHLALVLESIGYSRDRLFFTSHADAVLWYEICAGLEKGSMTLDFDSKGMSSYLIHSGNEDRGIPHYVETTDYSRFLPGGLDHILEDEERTKCFTDITELAISKKAMSRLYVTGTFLDKPAIIKVLERYFNTGRRIFTGRGLYCMGACYHAVKEKFPKKAIGDEQIFHTVSLEAYQDALEGPVRLLKAGTSLRQARARIQVILDDTKEMKFHIEDARTAESMSCTLRAEEFYCRENKTLRLELEVRFMDYETLVIKIRDVGFGEICPATWRVWEQIVHLA